MNKKVIGKIAVIVGLMTIIAIVIAKLYDIGVHRPSLVYRQLSPETIQWLNTLNQFDPENALKAAAVGPFGWDNKDDIGQKNTDGSWSKEEDANLVVYYRKDRDAQGQIRARQVIDCAENIILELQTYFGYYHYPAELNGRKIAIYLPDTDEEYTSLLTKMSDNGTTTTNKNGCSIIAIGPLGCQNKGIILRPSAFQNSYEEKGQDYVYVLRHELAYYTYLASLDYNRDTYRYAWFVHGITENFATDGDSLPALTPEYINMLERECMLNGEFPTKNKMYQWGGTSFVRFYERTFGNTALNELISATYTMPVDSAISQFSPDTDVLKQQWIESLKSSEP